MTLVHGDAKIDNFLFKKVGQSAEDKYTAMIIDWQVTALTNTDFLSNLNYNFWSSVETPLIEEEMRRLSKLLCMLGQK